MKNANDTKRQDATIAERRAFHRLDPAACATLTEAWQVLEPRLGPVLEAFYRHLQATPEMAALISAHARGGVERLKEAQKRHWARLFSGRFDDDYAAGVRRIGEAHARIGLDPRWYLGGYAMALAEIARVFGAANRWNGRRVAELTAAVTEAVFLDMGLALDVYFEAARKEAEAARSRLAAEFEREMGVLIAGVASAGTELSANADTLASVSGRVAERSVSAAAATEQASTNIATIASAAEELSASIAEITRQVSESARVAARAAGEARATDRTIASLAETAGKIGDIVRLINDIAGQTNLLALNATIEAARAGEAGKGFAVVASEVKNLASQTAKATEDIAAQVAAIQAETTRAVEAIRGIGAIVAESERAAAAIAASVEEQGAATKEIARSVQEAVRGTSLASEAVSGVQDAAREADEAVKSLRAAAAELARNGEALRAGVDSFHARVRIAA
ncbi:globin-coupled sensor protein [Elioraea thermophila]|uniref:globin-coupled sensor protein n=1 Tax=Elioraea thermophila TaxID=2185104 RepID=UPI000DF254C0|nr:globin-coupled sensor protein [Elioraea thermophila]